MNEKSSSTQEISASIGAVLSVRLWVPGLEDAIGGLVWKSGPPAAAVAIDLVEASGGTAVVTKGNLLVSNFPSVPSALVAARRIQWAVSACTEAASTENSGAAILIQSAEDQSQATSLLPKPSLDHATPGQILLAEAASRSYENLPGMPLSPPSAGLRELHWRRSENSSSIDDDQALDQLIRQHGLEDTIPPEHEAIATPVSEPATLPSESTDWNLHSRPPIDEPTDSEDESWLSRLQAMPLWLKAVAGAIPIGIAIVLFFVFFHSTPPVPVPDHHATVPSTSAQQPATAAPAERMTATPAHRTVVTEKRIPAIKPETSPKPQGQRPTPQPPPDVPRPTALCTLGAGDIPHALSIADNRFQNRQYKDAERGYRSVLACQPDNARAAAGAERAQKALQLQ